MKKFAITNSQNEKVIVDLVRYFKFKNDCYLIYTLNEVDEKNYLKLYLVRIMEELGFPVVQLIKNENDWAGMQNIIKKVIKEIKCEKYKYLEDLDYTTIDGIKVTEARFFKLDPKLTDILSSNYFEEETYNPSSTNDANSIIDRENDNNVNEYNDNISNIPVDTIGIDANNNIDNNDVSSIETILPVENSIDNNVNDTFTSDSFIQTSNYLELIENPDKSAEAINLDQISELTDNVVTITQNVELPIEDVIIPIDGSVNSNLGFDNDDIKNNNISEVTSVCNTDGNIVDNINELNNENLDVSNNVCEINDKTIEMNDDVDYKTLYLAIKKEVEVSNQLTDDLLEQLLKYKEKYGELDK